MPVVPKSFTYFEKRNPAANESKFWACRFEPTTSKVPALHVWWGRIGTKGQDKVFNYTTDAECIQDTRRRAEEKLRDGYTPVAQLAWWPEFIKLADREPTLMSQGFGLQGTNADGWPIVNGRETRPPSGGRGSRGEQRTLDPLAARDYFPPPEKPKSPLAVERVRGFDLARGRDRTVVTIVQIANERVIDFED